MAPLTHGPDNAEFEIKKAYDIVIDGALPYLWQRRRVEGVLPEEAQKMYRQAYDAYQNGNRLAAERWARASKHLSRAIKIEAKIAYLQEGAPDLPRFVGTAPQNDLHEESESTTDLLGFVAQHLPPGACELPQPMQRYLSRARKHLSSLEDSRGEAELLRSERLKAAYEYGRVLEIMTLALEAEAAHPKSA